MNNRTTWFYDNESGRYVVKNASIRFPNFAGEEDNYNAAGRRNFRLVIPEDLAEELRDRGVNVKTYEPRDDSEETTHHVKIGVYRDADIRLLEGKTMTRLAEQDFDIIDEEYRKAHLRQGEIGIEFHVSKNTRLMTSTPYTRLDTGVFPIRKSKLLADYSEADDELPM